MKKWISWIATALVCVATLLIFALTSDFFSGKDRSGVLKVGFIYSEDESTPYTYNFIQGEYALAEKYGSKVDIISMRNVHGGEADEPIRQLVRKGCRIIFTNLDTDAMPRLAAEYPDVQFCQVSMPTISMEGQPENYQEAAQIETSICYRCYLCHSFPCHSRSRLLPDSCIDSMSCFASHI